MDKRRCGVSVAVGDGRLFGIAVDESSSSSMAIKEGLQETKQIIRIPIIRNNELFFFSIYN
jgi:hypothetical protein